jgi:hypothetical protein
MSRGMEECASVQICKCENVKIGALLCARLPESRVPCLESAQSQHLCTRFFLKSGERERRAGLDPNSS